MIGALVPSVDRPGWMTVSVESLRVGDIVVPSFLIPMIIEGLADQGLSTSGGSVVSPIPRDVGSIKIDGDYVVLTPAEP